MTDAIISSPFVVPKLCFCVTTLPTQRPRQQEMEQSVRILIGPFDAHDEASGFGIAYMNESHFRPLQQLLNSLLSALTIREFIGHKVIPGIIAFENNGQISDRLREGEAGG